jgi:hypothetical protein
MKIIKKIIYNNRKTDVVSKIFDEILKEVAYFLKFDSITLEFKNEFKSEIESNNASIYLDYKNVFIQNSDEKAIRFLILKQFFYLSITRKIDKKLPKFIEDLIVGREMLKNGYSKELSYFYYAYLVNSQKIKNKSDILYANLPWLIFYKADIFNYNLFKKAAAKITEEYEDQNLKNLTNLLKKDLWSEKNLQKAIKFYEDFYANN